jgi:hypothetical protein
MVPNWDKLIITGSEDSTGHPGNGDRALARNAEECPAFQSVQGGMGCSGNGETEERK